MGKKRKQDKDEEEIRRKIRKLLGQLARVTNKDVDSPAPVEENSNNPLVEDTPYSDIIYESPTEDAILYDEDELSLYPGSCIPSPSPRNPTPPPASCHASPRPDPSPLPQPAKVAEDNVSTEEVVLSEDILQLLGDAPKPENPSGPPIHKDVARRWQDILEKGMPKEIKENLLKEYLIPGNLDFLQPATLNPEVKAALPDALVKRDASLNHKQRQLGAALSALATVTELIIANETSKQKLLKPLSDACRLLCDNHYADTRTRRGFVISAINTKLREALIESKRDKFLFGENLSEKLKSAKTIQQSGDALKNAHKPRFQRPNAASTSGSYNNNNNRGRLNYVPQHRKTDYKPNESRRPTNYAQRQSAGNAGRRPTDRSHTAARTSAPQRR